MTIPAPLRNQIRRDVTACIVEEGKDPEQCMMDAARYFVSTHRLTREQAEEIPDLMDYNSDEEE